MRLSSPFGSPKQSPLASPFHSPIASRRNSASSLDSVQSNASSQASAQSLSLADIPAYEIVVNSVSIESNFTENAYSNVYDENTDDLEFFGMWLKPD